MKSDNVKKATFGLVILAFAAGAKAAADVNEFALTGPDYNLGSHLLRMVIGVIMVVAMGVAAIYLSKKMLPKFGTQSGKKIKIIETVSLGQRRTLHLVEVGAHEILIGCSGESISKLADIIEPLTEIDLSEKKAGGK
ncbi:MAG: flagellar biosynthetic protein FliO [Anaerohalosphaeraceae bacterium]|nr:flagellar biosynthetic protein FliO [Anaerohalosphaeraceae bacterium]